MNSIIHSTTKKHRQLLLKTSLLFNTKQFHDVKLSNSIQILKNVQSQNPILISPQIPLNNQKIITFKLVESIINDLNSGHAISKSSLLKLLQTNQYLSQLNQNQLFTLFLNIQKSRVCTALTLPDWYQLLNTFTQSNQILLIYSEIKNCGIQPDHKIYQCLLHSTNKNLSKCLQIFNHTVQLHQNQFNSNNQLDQVYLSNPFIISLLDIISDNKDLQKLHDATRHIWDTLLNLGFHLENSTLNAFLKGFTAFKDKRMIEKIHKLLFARLKKSPDVSIYKNLMMAHKSISNYRAVKRLYEDLTSIHPNLKYSSDILFLYLESLYEMKEFKGLGRMNQELMKSKLYFTNDIYTILLNYCNSIQNEKYLIFWITCIQNHFKNHQSKVQLNYHILGHCIQSISEFGLLDYGLQLFEFYHHERIRFVSEHNLKQNMNYSTLEIAEYFNPCKTTSTTPTTLITANSTPTRSTTSTPTSTTATTTTSATTATTTTATPKAATTSKEEIQTEKENQNKSSTINHHTPLTKNATKAYIIKNFKNWIPKEIPRSILTSMIKLYCHQRQHHQLIQFMKTYALTFESLYLFWCRYLNHQQTNILNLIQKKNIQLNYLIKESKRLQLTKRIHHQQKYRYMKDIHTLKDMIEKLKQQHELGYTMKLGIQGPFSICYQTIEQYWKSNMNEMDDPLLIDDIINDLILFEKSILMSTPIQPLLRDHSKVVMKRRDRKRNLTTSRTLEQDQFVKLFGDDH
ncbi:hypothetical protein BC833DRAFT_599101 [Globomyces pollinis-pini]|nr:hypothetical protein BC833DRAFT_599101 [Globomyces pollinis-pini]